MKITGPHELALPDSALTEFLLENTSPSFETEIPRSYGSVSVKVFHFEGGDFTYEVMARKGLVGKWFVFSIEIVKGRVTG